MFIIIFYYAICISILISIIRSNHASDKVISFFAFILLTTIYICYLDTKFIAFSVLLWYGRRISAIFIILSQYTSARKLDYFTEPNYTKKLYQIETRILFSYFFFVPIFIIWFLKDIIPRCIFHMNHIFNDFEIDHLMNDY